MSDTPKPFDDACRDFTNAVVDHLGNSIMEALAIERTDVEQATEVCDLLDVPPHLLGIGPTHRWTWRIRRTWRMWRAHR